MARTQGAAKPKVVFVTRRSPRHQAGALATAPDACDVVMLSTPSRAVLLAQMAEAQVLISERSGVVDAELIRAAPQLRLIQRLGTLTHDIDIAAAQQAGVAVCYWPVLGCVRVAEHMVMQMLALTKRLPEASAAAQAADDWGRPSRRTDENIFAYNWTGRTGIGGLCGLRIGILGFGEIGAELARRLRCFDVESIVYNKRRRLPEQAEAELGIVYGDAATVVTQSDVLCVLLPYSNQTDLSLGRETFAAMPRGAYLVHCGSGSVIDEPALADALASGHLAGAALDTFEWEPLRPDNPLLALARDPARNVLLTPHTAAGTDSDEPDDWENVRRLLAGERLRYRIV